MNLRIAQLRAMLGLTQGAFASRLGLKRAALSMMESGKNAITDSNIRLICLTFNVNEAWLRAGQGPAFASSPLEREFFEIYEDLLPETQASLLAFARSLLETQRRLQAAVGGPANDGPANGGNAHDGPAGSGSAANEPAH